MRSPAELVDLINKTYNDLLDHVEESDIISLVNESLKESGLDIRINNIEDLDKSIDVKELSIVYDAIMDKLTECQLDEDDEDDEIEDDDEDWDEDDEDY